MLRQFALVDLAGFEPLGELLRVEQAGAANDPLNRVVILWRVEIDPLSLEIRLRDGPSRPLVRVLEDVNARDLEEEDRRAVVRVVVLGGRLDDVPAALFCRLAEHGDGDAVNEAVDRCSDKIQRAEKPEGASGLLQALLGQAAELRQPRLQQRPEALDLIRVDTVV